MIYFLMALAVVVIVLLLGFIKKQFFSASQAPAALSQTSSDSMFSHCPVCNTGLGPGQNVRSKIFTSAASENDKLCYVYGCPACFPSPKPGIKRECPVCHKVLPNDSYLLSRIFYKTKSGKPHVIINGCPNCNRHSN